MSKIVISETQYKRIFLQEQPDPNLIQSDPYLNQYNTPISDRYSDFYPITQGINPSISNKFDNINTLKFNNFLNSPTIATIDNARKQWSKWGAPDARTGHKKLPQEYINSLQPTENQYSDVEVWSTDHTQDETGAGGLGYASRRQASIDFKHQDQMRRNELWKPFHSAVEWNNTIDNQYKLIPKFCQPKTVWKWHVTAVDDLDRSNPEIVKQCKNIYAKHIKRPGQRYQFMNNAKGPDGSRYYTYEGEQKWFCKYRLDVGKGPMNVCNNQKEKGPFVYKNDKMSGGYICACIDLQDKFIGDQAYATGKGYEMWDKDVILGIEQSHKKYLKDNAPGFLESVGNFIDQDWGQLVTDCITDYHCWLDIASIAALAIPGVGILVSAGLDGINSGMYFYEATQAETAFERNMLYAAATLTSAGMIPGIGKGMKIMKQGSKATNKVIGDIMTDYTKFVKLGNKPSKEALEQIFEKAVIKTPLKEADELIVKNFFKAMEEGQNSAAKHFKNFDNFSKRHKADLEDFLNNPPEKFADLLKQTNNNVPDAFHLFRKSKAYKETLTQFKWFTALYALLPPISKTGMSIYNRHKKEGQHGIKAQVEVEYPGAWDLVKSLVMSDGTGAENEMLKRSWDAGWRPNIKLVGGKWVEQNPISVIPERFWTSSYKKYIESIKNLNTKFNSDKEEGGKNLNDFSDEDIENF